MSLTKDDMDRACDHVWKCVGDEGDFGTGQEFDIYVCDKCGKREYEEVAQ